MNEGQQIKILTVDDSPLALIHLRMLLSQISDKINVTEASSIEDAKVELKHEEFDFVFMDLMFPEKLNGADLIFELKENQSSKELKIIVVTGSKKGSIMQSVLEQEVLAFMHKPLSKDSIEELITPYLN